MTLLIPLKSAIYIKLMSNVQLPGSRTFDSQIPMNYFTKKMMSVWINNPKKICLRMIVNMGSLIRENIRKYPVKENVKTDSIMFRIIMMLHTNM